MPILHVQFDAKGQTPSGDVIQILPRAGLQQRGPCVQVMIGLAESFAQQLLQRGEAFPTPSAGIALIDTGASVTCVDESLAQRLRLPAIDVAQMMSASHAETQQNVYPIEIEIVGAPIRINVPRAVGASLAPQGITALIGRDFLQHCTLFYNGFTGAITLAI